MTCYVMIALIRLRNNFSRPGEPGVLTRTHWREMMDDETSRHSEADRSSKQPDKPGFNIFSYLLLASSLIVFAVVAVIFIAVSVTLFFGDTAQKPPQLASLMEQGIRENYSCDTGRLYVGNIREVFPTQAHRNGIYIQQPHYEQGRPVFKHERLREYLYYSVDAKGDGYWVIGGGFSGVGMRVRSDALHPEAIRGYWTFRETQARWTVMWSISPVCVDDTFVTCLSGRILVSGSTLSSENGAYSLTNITHNLRPVYRHELHHDLHLHHKFGVWFIGKITGHDGTFSISREPRPEYIVRSLWYSTTRGKWGGKKGIRVTCHPQMIKADDKHACTRPNSCSDHGHCIAINDKSYICDCDEDYIGAHCERQFSCGLPPPVPYAVFKTLTSTGFLSLAYYECVDGYARTGKNTVVCGADGNWTKPLLVCTSRPLLATA